MQSFSARSEARENVKYNVSSLMLYVTFVFHTNTGFVLGIFHPLSPFPYSHSTQSRGHGAGCRRHPPCPVHLHLMNGSLKHTQLKSLSISVIASFYPTAKIFRGQKTCSIICLWNVFTVIYVCAILQNKRHKETASFIYSLKSHFKGIVRHIGKHASSLSCQE